MGVYGPKGRLQIEGVWELIDEENILTKNRK